MRIPLKKLGVVKFFFLYLSFQDKGFSPFSHYSLLEENDVNRSSKGYMMDKNIGTKRVI